MYANTVELQRLSLMVLRLMDADLLLPEEGSALLAEIEALEQARDNATAARVASSCARLLPQLEVLVRTDRLDASTGGQAQEIVRRILREAGDLA
ncbi:MAG TPA: hypothetical protein VKU00_21055 [Chthonomonadaceae bacterium]|nr:hypothetical protein [Chthonomonadaceae bacterium]